MYYSTFLTSGLVIPTRVSRICLTMVFNFKTSTTTCGFTWGHSRISRINDTNPLFQELTEIFTMITKDLFSDCLIYRISRINYTNPLFQELVEILTMIAKVKKNCFTYFAAVWYIGSVGSMIPTPCFKNW